LAALTAKAMPVHADLIAYVASTLGRSAAVTADFGAVPKARKVPDAATKAAAVQKRKATRAVTLAKQSAKAAAAVNGAATTTPTKASG
jgi:hypothetical protein